MGYVLIAHNVDNNIVKEDIIIQEIIRITMHCLSSKIHRTYITKKQILKILFQVKEKLSDDNPIKKYLAYYWYKEGPYSERVEYGIEQLKLKNVVKLKQTDNSQVYEISYAYTTKRLVDHDDSIITVRNKIQEITNNWTNIHDIVQEIYKKAPLTWYDTFVLKFNPQFKLYCKKIFNDQKDTPDSRNTLLDVLDDAILEYPRTPEFMKHKMIFMDFAKMLNAFMYSKYDDVIHQEVLRVLETMIDKIWELFACKVRILYHDDYYNNHLDNWKEKYEYEVNKLDAEIIQYTKKFEDVIIDNRKLAPEVEDVILHPEKHTFEPFVTDLDAK